MQTFLPYADYAKSAACLDRQRLGKQRVECIQILNSLTSGSRWVNHPAVQMWKGSEHELIDYGLAICKEWQSRGYDDTCSGKIAAYEPIYRIHRLGIKPWFIGDTRFHSSHRAALLYKMPGWYCKFHWTEEPAKPDRNGSLPYFWPTKNFVVLPNE